MYNVGLLLGSGVSKVPFAILFLCFFGFDIPTYYFVFKNYYYSSLQLELWNAIIIYYTYP